MRSTISTKRSGTNFAKAVETLHGRLVMVLQLFQINIYNLFKHFIDILSICHKMLKEDVVHSETKHFPSHVVLWGL